MRHTISLLIGLAVFGVKAQVTPIVKNGMTLTLSHKDYGLSHTPEINSKTKSSEREKLVDEFNEKVLSGNMKYFKKAPVTMEVSNESSSEKGNSYRVLYQQSVIGGSGCRSVNRFDGALFFTKDTTSWAVNVGPQYIMGFTPDYKADTVAILTFPVLRYPNKMKVGDKLPVSMMHWVGTPQKSFNQVVRGVVSGYKSSTSVQNVEVQKFGIGVGNYGYDQRWALVTSYEAVYEYVPLEVETTIKMGLSRIFNVGAAVTHTESISISGKSYLAYVIRSEEWNGDMKVQMDSKTYASEKANVSDRIAAKAEELEGRRHEKAARKVSSAMNKGADNKNDMGYTVMLEDRWYVPELGLEVKKIRYNKYGMIEYILEPESLTFN